MLKRATLLIPLTFNDGTEIPRATLDAIEEEIYIAFNGWTIVGEVEGGYRMKQTGQKQVERLLHVWVVAEEADIPLLRRMVRKYGALLGQEAMYFEVGESRVEFLPPLAEEETSDE
jgi:hypothetical protein